jgi:pimeloyl-ACP methyl ester carboxylesterase
MTKKSDRSPADFIAPLYINGLQGRMLHLPAPRRKRREILFVYGHHSSLERWWGVVQDLNQYGAVTMPDLPGFGGMQSFYKIGLEPTIDNLADYLAAFIKLRYKRRKLTLVGLSFGFVVATRMLQRCPDLVKNVELLVSVAGFSHRDDFSFSKLRHSTYIGLTWFFSRQLPALFFKNVFLHPAVLRLAYAHTHNARQKFKNIDRSEHKETMDFEIHLWHGNDLRTHMKTSNEFLNLDNCQKQVNLQLTHIAIKADNYFDNYRVEQHLGVIFSNVNTILADMDTHAPSVIADMKTAAPMIPKQVRQLFSK